MTTSLAVSIVFHFRFHWHDNHGRKDEHLPIGEGLIDHEKTVRALKNIEYDRTITLEVFTNTNDAKSSTDKLKIIWAKESYYLVVTHLVRKIICKIKANIPWTVTNSTVCLHGYLDGWKKWCTSDTCARWVIGGVFPGHLVSARDYMRPAS
jgi:hypothetical protein